MADDKRNGLLYVACRRERPRQLLAPAELRLWIDSNLQADGVPWFDWTIVSSQKLALSGLRRALPQVVLVELDSSSSPHAATPKARAGTQSATSSVFLISICLIPFVLG